MLKNRRLILATLLSGTALAAAGAIAGPLVLLGTPASHDVENGGRVQPVDWDEEEDDNGWRKDTKRHHHGEHGRHHDDDEHGDDDDDDDDNGGRQHGRAGSPAPVGSVAPPNNGLILQGSTPKVQVN